jgi:uncharacterized BrkB/YihY/UPF0761 family membrane protein
MAQAATQSAMIAAYFIFGVLGYILLGTVTGIFMEAQWHNNVKDSIDWTSFWMAFIFWPILFPCAGIVFLVLHVFRPIVAKTIIKFNPRLHDYDRSH